MNLSLFCPPHAISDWNATSVRQYLMDEQDRPDPPAGEKCPFSVCRLSYKQTRSKQLTRHLSVKVLHAHLDLVRVWAGQTRLVFHMFCADTWAG